MKYKTLFYIVGVVSLLSTGCMGSGSRTLNSQNSNLGYPSSNIQSSKVTATSTMEEVKKSLEYMYEEERLAKEVYLSIYQKQPVRQLYRIATNSETRHISAVEALARKYGVRLYPQRVGVYRNPHIQSLFNSLYAKGVRSQKDALEVGCMVEVTDVEDLNRYIATAQRAGASDVVQTYEFLRRGSYNHYWAFDRGLKSLGVSNGCCALGSKYCHPEYPQNQRGRGRGRGRGHGMGYGMGGGPWR